MVHAHNYNLLLCETNGMREREDAFFSMLKQKTVDGILAIDPGVSVENLIEYGSSYPVVLCCENKDSISLPYVGVDDKRGAMVAVTHLVETGCRRIAMANAAWTLGFARLRREGYIEALRVHGIEYDPSLVVQYDFGVDGATEVATKLLSLRQERPFDGVFFDYDVIAVGAQRLFIESGLRIPEDVSIIGFDGSDMTLICTPTLTTIAQPAYQIGVRSAEMLFAVLGGKEMKQRRVTLDFELKVRQSTRQTGQPHSL